MTSAKDLFSGHAADYFRYRPRYPKEIFIYLSGLCKNHDLAWDCGTGNGQSAVELAPYFKNILATDMSAQQIEQALPEKNITYQVCPAEHSPLQDHTVDLVTVAQALHWFHHDDFFREVARVAKPGAILAYWCYASSRINPPIDKLIHYLYDDILKGMWEPERRHIDDYYANICPAFQKIETKNFIMSVTWTHADFFNYLNTWSSVKTYIKKYQQNPLDIIFTETEKLWGQNIHKEIIWDLPVFTFRITN